jgi:hypothetical protein
VLICIPCLEVRQAQPDIRLGLHDPGPYPPMTRAEMWESLELLPSWVLAQKAAANRQVIAVTRRRLAAGEAVARMYQEPGLAWLERQAEAAEHQLAEWQAGDQNQCRAGAALKGVTWWRGQGAGRGTAPGPATRSPGRGCPGRCRCS